MRRGLELPPNHRQRLRQRVGPHRLRYRRRCLQPGQIQTQQQKAVHLHRQRQRRRRRRRWDHCTPDFQVLLSTAEPRATAAA